MVGLKGFVSFGNNFKLEGLGETIELDMVKENADVYDGIAATSNNGTINKNVMIGSLKVTTDDGKVDVAANKSAVLYKADGNGNLVSNNKGTADVSLGDGSTLTLAGNGKAGAIEAGTANKGTVAFGHAKASGTVEAKSIGAKTAVASVKVNAGNVVLTAAPGADHAPVKLQAQSLSLAKGTSLTAKDQDVVISAAAASGADDVKGALVLNQPIKVTSGNGILVNTSLKDQALKDAVSGDKFIMANNAALIIDDGVFARGADGQLTGTAITIAEGTASYVDVDGTSSVLHC